LTDLRALTVATGERRDARSGFAKILGMADQLTFLEVDDRLGDMNGMITETSEEAPGFSRGEESRGKSCIGVVRTLT
jgi:hypothetical protein